MRLPMCDFDENCTPGIILETEYTAMELTDLTGNGAKDLLLITSDTSGKRVARLYQYDNGPCCRPVRRRPVRGQLRLSACSPAVCRTAKTAVFAEEKVANGAGLTTDIFVYSNDTLRNLHWTARIPPATALPSGGGLRERVNGDGITELPRAVLMAGL